jgi:hypothetical protein
MLQSTILASIVHRVRPATLTLGKKASRLKRRRPAYREAVLARLSGRPGDAACMAACIGAAEGYITIETLREHGLVALNNCSPRLPPDHSRYRREGRKAVRGKDI